MTVVLKRLRGPLLALVLVGVPASRDELVFVGAVAMVAMSIFAGMLIANDWMDIRASKDK